MDAAADTSPASRPSFRWRNTPPRDSITSSSHAASQPVLWGNNASLDHLTGLLTLCSWRSLGDGAHADDEGWANQDASLPGDR